MGMGPEHGGWVHFANDAGAQQERGVGYWYPVGSAVDVALDQGKDDDWKRAENVNDAIALWSGCSAGVCLRTFVKACEGGDLHGGYGGAGFQGDCAENFQCERLKTATVEVSFASRGVAKLHTRHHQSVSTGI